MAVVSMKALLETGVHFGHRTRRWNPKMKPFIFTERNGIHIIDLQQTIQAIDQAYALIRDTVAQGGTVLFVGTKRQAQETIAQQAQRCGMPYVNQRWLGGTLTNWRTMRTRIEYLRDLEARRDAGEFERLPKKEALELNREIEALNERFGGLKEMRRLPDLLFIVDVRREETAVREANALNIPIIAMVDTNCDPDRIDLVIPANDDAIRAIKLIVSRMADAVLEGMNMRKEAGLPVEVVPEPEEYAYEYTSEEEEDERYLGEATLAKLRGGELFPAVLGEEDFEAAIAEEDVEELAEDEAFEDEADDIEDEEEEE
uniref:30S ribosomal protein S2 n=1 Tax=uncultured prokaryote TaxID=198431 RepID=H5SIS7_9ZZZZ|nr:30S ribosomal protein S2 [uncultured prokaryote]